MTSDQAQRIATEFVKTQDPRFAFAGIRDLWCVVLELDGLAIVVTDSTRKAEFYDDWSLRTRA